MLRTHNRIQKIALTLGATFAMGGVLPLAASADGHSIFHRHPTATGAVAGYGAYRLARHSAHRRVASGRHRNIFQRHPVATGIGAAALAHHYAKKHH